MEITAVREKGKDMFTGQQKKISIIAILKILYEHSDTDHRLSAKEIIDHLWSDYNIKLDRKAVKRNLMDLLDFGYDIEYTETPKKNPKGEEEIIYSDWYINHTFDNSELRLLIDSLLFSKHMPYSQCKDLIGKLVGLSSTYFKDNVKHIHNLPDGMPYNKNLLYTIEILDEAISKKKQVSFNYADYGIDKKMHVKTDKDGNPINYIINPYQMVATNGRYYLICGTDKHDTLGHYRIDRIVNIQEPLKTNIKPLSKIKGAERGLDLPKHMAEHIYMFSGESIRVKFLVELDMINEIVDWFGFDFDVIEKNDGLTEISVLVNEQAMFYWAMLYSTRVEVISPKRLRDKITESLAEVAEKYNSI
jgi:predicted DNA-binding transcriptional regulator YafY